MLKSPHLAGQPSAAQDRGGLSHLQSDPAAKLKSLVPLLPYSAVEAI